MESLLRDVINRLDKLVSEVQEVRYELRRPKTSFFGSFSFPENSPALKESFATISASARVVPCCGLGKGARRR